MQYGSHPQNPPPPMQLKVEHMPPGARSMQRHHCQSTANSLLPSCTTSTGPIQPLLCCQPRGCGCCCCCCCCCCRPQTPASRSLARGLTCLHPPTMHKGHAATHVQQIRAAGARRCLTSPHAAPTAAQSLTSQHGHHCHAGMPPYHDPSNGYPPHPRSYSDPYGHMPPGYGRPCE